MVRQFAFPARIIASLRSQSKPSRLNFDCRLKLEFHGSRVTSAAGLLAYRELDDALGVTGMAGDELVDPRTGQNGQHALTGLIQQSVFGRLGGYEDVNDADCLRRDLAMHWIVGGRAVAKAAASTSQMGRFETEFLAANRNLSALAGLSGRWIDRVHDDTHTPDSCAFLAIEIVWPAPILCTSCYVSPGTVFGKG